MSSSIIGMKTLGLILAGTNKERFTTSDSNLPTDFWINAKENPPSMAPHEQDHNECLIIIDQGQGDMVVHDYWQHPDIQAWHNGNHFNPFWNSYQPWAKAWKPLPPPKMNNPEVVAWYCQNRVPKYYYGYDAPEDVLKDIFWIPYKKYKPLKPEIKQDQPTVVPYLVVIEDSNGKWKTTHDYWSNWKSDGTFGYHFGWEKYPGKVVKFKAYPPVGTDTDMFLRWANNPGEAHPDFLYTEETLGYTFDR